MEFELKSPENFENITKNFRRPIATEITEEEEIILNTLNVMVF